jgi:hypothetical protein
MTDLLPAPLTPANCDLSDFPRMMIDIPRLRQSGFDAIIDDSAWRAGLNLWMSAWHSVPAGSLDADDAALTKAAGLGRDLRTWAAVRDNALRGFVLCSDGRFYHETVCEVALEAWIEKLIQRLASGAGNAKRWKAEFDPAPLEADLFRAGELLAALNPDSKVLVKARRRSSQSDENSIPPGRGTDPTGSNARSDRDPTGQERRSDRTAPPRGESSQEKGREGNSNNPPTPQADADPRLARLMKAGGFITVPSDWRPVLESWLARGADFETDIIPVLEQAGPRLRERTNRAPYKLKVFEPDLAQHIATVRGDIERLREIPGRQAELERAQREADAARESEEQEAERQRQMRAYLAAAKAPDAAAEGEG